MSVPSFIKSDKNCDREIADTQTGRDHSGDLIPCYATAIGQIKIQTITKLLGGVITDNFYTEGPTETTTGSGGSFTSAQPGPGLTRSNSADSVSSVRGRAQRWASSLAKLGKSLQTASL